MDARLKCYIFVPMIGPVTLIIADQVLVIKKLSIGRLVYLWLKVSLGINENVKPSNVKFMYTR